MRPTKGEEIPRGGGVLENLFKNLRKTAGTLPRPESAKRLSKGTSSELQQFPDTPWNACLHMHWNQGQQGPWGGRHRPLGPGRSERPAGTALSLSVVNKQWPTSEGVCHPLLEEH